jgi:capsular polysaccharide transport system ATP-binding protein
MIILNRVTKTRKVNGKARDVLSLVDINIPSDRRIALFSPSIEDSNSLINLLAGIETPTSGHIRRTANVSFPVGHTGGLEGELTLRHNILHVSRLYGADPLSVIDFMKVITGLTGMLDVRLRDLPHNFRRRFAHNLAYSIPFDVYLLKAEPTRVPADHRGIALALFEARTRASGAIIATCNPAFANQYCDMALSLIEGKLVLFRDVEQALSASLTRGPEHRDVARIHNFLDS